MADITNMGQPPIPQMPFVTNTGERMDPVIIQFLMSASIAAQLSKTRQLAESRVPTGFVSYSIKVSDTTYVMPLIPHWISLHLTNDDDTYDLYWAINDEEDMLTNAPIAAQGEFDADMRHPVIHTIYMRAPSGQTVNIRIFGAQG